VTKKRKERPTPEITTIPPGPDGWVPRAQSALDELSATCTVSEVEARFGTARRVTEQILGFPLSGGHATRRTVRAVGRLLTHRLGPALAAEVLTWSATLGPAVETSTIEDFLEGAVHARGTHRPWRLDHAPAALEAVARIPRPARQRRTLGALWQHTRSHLDEPAPSSLVSAAIPPFELDDEIEDLSRWLRESSPEWCPVDVPALLVMGPDEQRRVVDRLSDSDIDWLARREELFSMDENAIGTCLLRATRSTLDNEACPAGLRDRVRRPYDLATLELALRMGSGWSEPGRVRRMLAALDSESLGALVSAIPEPTLGAMREVGLLSADELLTGRLRHLDLADPRTRRAAVGQRLAPETVELVTALAVRHPQGTALVGMIDGAEQGTLSPEMARRLIDQGDPPIATAAMRHLPLELLVASDREYAVACGVAWSAACPGLAGDERPAIPEELLEDWRAGEQSMDRIWYPEPVRQLDGAAFAEAPGWRVSLPVRVADIWHNAKVMRNCTAGLVGDVVDGSLFLVIVHDPSGRRYNVAVVKDGSRFSVGHINSWSNGGIRPAWIGPAFNRRLRDGEPTPWWDELPDPGRRPTTHRDRRRARASAARRVRR
jgi:hypothetical protein